jgi:hypothetical protein
VLAVAQRQVGAASGGIAPATAAVVAKRREGLAAAHGAAKASVASWVAGRERRAAGPTAHHALALRDNGMNMAGVNGKSGAPIHAPIVSSSSGHRQLQRFKLPEEARSKAALLAARNRLQGIGLSLPEPPANKSLPRF